MAHFDDPLKWAVDAFRDDRARDYEHYRNYLEGRQDLAYATPKFRQAFGRLFDAFSYNRCQSVVDAHTDRMRVAGFGGTHRETETETDALTKAAWELWDRNHMSIHEGQLQQEAFGLGDGYLIVTMHPETGEAQMWPQRADQMRVHYDHELPGVITIAAKMWRDYADHMRLTVYHPDRIEKYRTVNRAHQVPTSPTAFEPYQPEGDTQWPISLPVKDTVPVFHFANNARINDYGVSELRDVIGLQDALNKSLMDQLVASEFAAAPQRVILGYDASDTESQRALDNLVTGINRMLAIPADQDGNVPRLAEFGAADMRQYDLVAEKWDIRISRVSKVPVHYLTQTQLASSGRAMRLAETPFIEKIRDRQDERGPVLAAAMTYGLQLEGKAVKPGDLHVTWEPAAPMNEDDQWDMAAAQAAAGLPLETILEDMGREPQQIKRILEQRIREMALQSRIDQSQALMAMENFDNPLDDDPEDDR